MHCSMSVSKCELCNIKLKLILVFLSTEKSLSFEKWDSFSGDLPDSTAQHTPQTNSPIQVTHAASLSLSLTSLALDETK